MPSSSAPVFPPSPLSSRRLALATLKGSTDSIVRDVTNIDHPFTVSNLAGQVDYATRFVSAAELSTVGGQGLVRMSLDGRSRVVVARCANYPPAAWSADGTAAAYLLSADYPAPWALHIVAAGVDRTVASVPGLAPMGCESRSCGDSWDLSLLFSPDGRYVSLLMLVGSLRVWTIDGKLVKSVATSGVAMQVWSGGTLYWRDEKGVETWRDGTQTLLLPGVSWVRPKASPAGGVIVFQTRDPGYATAHVFLLDTATGKTHQIATSRSEPAFLTASYLWYRGEKPCTAACVDPTEATGTTYLYDLQSGTEAQSIIAFVWDVWPHAA